MQPPNSLFRIGFRAEREARPWARVRNFTEPKAPAATINPEAGVLAIAPSFKSRDSGLLDAMPQLPRIQSLGVPNFCVKGFLQLASEGLAGGNRSGPYQVMTDGAPKADTIISMH